MSSKSEEIKLKDVFTHLLTQGFITDVRAKSYIQFVSLTQNWKRVNAIELERAVKFLAPSFTHQRIRDVLVEFKLTHYASFDDREYFCCSNGYFKIGDSEFKKYDNKTYLIPHVSWPYKKNSSPKLLIKTLSEILDKDNDKINLALDVASLALSNKNVDPIILCIIGNGSNGKSLFMKVIKGTFGVRKVASLGMDEISEKFKTCLLEGRSLNMFDENSNNLSSKNLNTLKRLGDGAHTLIEKKYENPVETYIKINCIFSMNDVPKFPEKNIAVLRRFFFINFDVNFENSKKDRTLLDKLLKDRSAIFDLLHSRVIGRKNGKIEIPCSIREASKTIINQTSTTEIYLNEKCKVTGDRNDYVLKDELYQSYQDYCELKDIAADHMQTFCSQVINSNRDIQKSKRTVKDKSRKSCFLGITITVTKNKRPRRVSNK